MTNTYEPTEDDLTKWPCRRGPGCANHNRYYRGYNIKLDSTTKRWNIYWGDYLGTRPTLAEAEALVDEWKVGV